MIAKKFMHKRATAPNRVESVPLIRVAKGAAVLVVGALRCQCASNSILAPSFGDEFSST